MFVIYQAINTLNKESYIGFTSKDPKKRWKKHILNARLGVPGHFYNAIRKYGSEMFIWEILEGGWDPKIGKDIWRAIRLEFLYL